jgi:hypothetical protein
VDKNCASGCSRQFGEWLNLSVWFSLCLPQIVASLHDGPHFGRRPERGTKQYSHVSRNASVTIDCAPSQGTDGGFATTEIF